MEAGDEWTYQLRDSAPAERIRIVRTEPTGRTSWVTVEFLAGPRAGDREDVPRRRLRGRWPGMLPGQIDEEWTRIDDYPLNDIESCAIETVFKLLIPDDVAYWSWKPVHDATVVLDPVALESIIGRPMAEIVQAVPSFHHEGEWRLSPRGTLLIAEGACRTKPMRILDHVTAEERDKRELCKRGGQRRRLRGREIEPTSPDIEYESYLQHGRPIHELLRQWCSHRAVTFHERYKAAEAEVHRLDVLVAQLIDALKTAGDADAANAFDEEHERDRITPHSMRPIVERPLDASEIPTQIVYRRAWWH